MDCALAASGALLLAACASTPDRSVVAAPGRDLSPDLPAGQGRTILRASCTSCHDLGEVTKLRGYYDRKQWRDLVVTMVDYGADLEKDEVEVLADYLTQHLGRRN